MHSREQLIHALAEAAELEHNLLCSYLFAAFSLKQECAEDLTSSELETIRGWRESLMQVCVEEMVHLAQVSNILVAIGARPHLNRPNLPVPRGYHPGGIVIELAAFDLETIEHFIFLERPAEARIHDSPAYAAEQGGPPRDLTATYLMPSAPAYETIGEFYEFLRSGMTELAGRLGEAKLFCGDASLQLRGTELHDENLVLVTDLASARRAVDYVIEQGEGSGSAGEKSHYQQFQRIRTEYLELRRLRSSFCAHRPVARNPVMHPPAEADRVHVTAPDAAALLDAVNASYNAMLRCLVEVYGTSFTEVQRRKALLDGALACMKALTAFASQLTRLAAQVGGEVRAGASFATLRGTEGLGSAVAPVLLSERLGELAAVFAGFAVAQLHTGSLDLEAAAKTLDAARASSA